MQQILFVISPIDDLAVHLMHNPSMNFFYHLDHLVLGRFSASSLILKLIVELRDALTQLRNQHLAVFLGLLLFLKNLIMQLLQRVTEIHCRVRLSLFSYLLFLGKIKPNGIETFVHNL